MILTFKQKHDFDFSVELEKARRVAEFGLINKTFSSKDVKQFGLKSVISNQILRKYGKNKKIKKVSNIKLIIPLQGIKLDISNSVIRIPCLKKKFIYRCHFQFEKINCIEIDNNYFYVSCSVSEKPAPLPIGTIGVDLNSTGHACVVANPQTGKILKMGKSLNHIHKKYKNIRARLQKKAKFKLLRKIKNRESRIVRDQNHKISRKVVDFAVKNNCSINMENLKGITKKKGGKKSLSHNLNSWSFYQLRTMIEYKARLQGVGVRLIDPFNTSQICSRCGLLGTREGKVFKSPKFGVENADVNAAFNIAANNICNSQLQTERDVCKGSLTPLNSYGELRF